MTQSDDLDPSDADLPLQFGWALWYSQPKMKSKQKQQWDRERVSKVAEFKTIANFWGIFNNLTPPSKLEEGSDLQLFRSGVMPQWEDPHNSRGGSWKIIFQKNSTQDFDSTWFHTILLMICDKFDDADDICGIVASSRESVNRLQIWTQHSSDKDVVARIGKYIKEKNNLNQTLRYLSHDEYKDFSRTKKTSEMIV